MDNRVLFMLSPGALRSTFSGASLRHARSLSARPLSTSTSQQRRKALTDANKHYKRRELLYWLGCIDRTTKDDAPGLKNMSMSFSEPHTTAQHHATNKITNIPHPMMITRPTDGPLDELILTLRTHRLERTYNEDTLKKPTPLTDAIKTLYLQCIEKIRLCDELYYADNPAPLVPDNDYDELLMHLLDLERFYPQLVRADSPSQVVGHAVGTTVPEAASPLKARTQMRHPVPMLSLANAYTHSDLSSFAKRAENASVCVEMKIDGVALSLHYESRQLVRAITRGNGRIGDDVTANIRAGLIGRGVPEWLPDEAPEGLVIVRGEVFISRDDFEILQKEQSLSNARNTAAGAIKHKDSAEVRTRRPQFIAYECQTEDDSGIDGYQSIWPTQSGTLSALASWGFGDMPNFAVFDTMEQAEAYANTIEKGRYELPFEADGVVLKIDDAQTRFALGCTAKSPRGAIALKFTARTTLTTVLSVRMQVSRNGSITPVAELEPAVIGGATIRRATLHNFDEVARLGIAVGDIVLLERGGDVIPKITRVEQQAIDNRTPIVPPSTCPCCGGGVKIERNETGNTTVSCTDATRCVGQSLGRLVHFVSRDSMDITGVGQKKAMKLLECGLVLRLGDLFELTFDQLLEVPGFKEKSARGLYNAIQEARTKRSLERLIVALGVPGVGRTGARALALRAKTVDGLRKLTRSADLLSIPNMAERSVERIAEFLSSERIAEELAVLVKHVEISAVVDEPEEEGRKDVVVQGIPISGKLFVLTGSLTSMSRKEASGRIKEAGGIVSSALSGKTDYLIAGAEAGSKLHKAQRLGVRVLVEDDLVELFADKSTTEEFMGDSSG